MKRITRARANKHALDQVDKPLLRVKQGESFVVETEDAFDGDVKAGDAASVLRHMDLLGPHGNPVGGPVYIEGAERGDLLAVTIEEIRVADQGLTVIFPGVGPLADSRRWQKAAKSSSRAIRHLAGPSGTTRDGEGVIGKFRWPLRPFIGTLGVAPEHGSDSTVYGQGPWGGNLDCRDFQEGATVLLNCYHRGALLYLGDVHATQGDTEFYGTADESRAEVQVSCSVIKKKKAGFVRIVKPDSIVSVHSFRPLEQAIESAILDLMEWMVQDYGVSEQDAYMHTSINPDFSVHVYQMVRAGRLQYTCGAEIPRKYLAAR